MRPGEALALDRQDVDLRHGVVHVRAGKQKKQREVPLHQSTISALRDYARLRDARFPEPSTPAFFIGARGRRMPREELNRTFTQLIREVGLEGRGARARPRPHDLRHALAVHTLLDWHEAGEDIDRRMPLLSTFLGHVDPASTYWYLEAVPELLELISRRLEQLPRGALMTALAPALQAFFTQRLITQRSSSPETIAAYRDAFRLLLRFAHEQTGKQPFELDIDDLDAPLIGAFLNHLEQDRGNSPRTRNARLGAIHSFYRFAALEHPEHATRSRRVMAIPTKRSRAQHRHLPRSRRDQSAARRARPRHLARPPRPRATDAHDPDRRARLRTHRPARRRRPPRHRQPTSGSWEKAGRSAPRP